MKKIEIVNTENIKFKFTKSEVNFFVESMSLRFIEILKKTNYFLIGHYVFLHIENQYKLYTIKKFLKETSDYQVSLIWEFVSEDKNQGCYMMAKKFIKFVIDLERKKEIEL